ncbi:MAG: cytochrome C oxidase subunit II [Ardenticatenales bacterium]|nr:cytochrome C oxidase subunit II [Ardenticatenales bacterium]
MIERSSTLVAPGARWWSPLGRDERLWFMVVLVWALAMFLMIFVIWPAIGDQQLTFSSYRTDPATFKAAVDASIAAHQVGDLEGRPLVAPPPGDVYLLGERFQFTPALRLKKGETYRLLLSSSDVQHGLSIQPDNINFQVLPGYVSAITLTPKQDGEYTIVCNEYCGIGHHLMVGQIAVVP